MQNWDDLFQQFLYIPTLWTANMFLKHFRQAFCFRLFTVWPDSYEPIILEPKLEQKYCVYTRLIILSEWKLWNQKTDKSMGILSFVKPNIHIHLLCDTDFYLVPFAFTNFSLNQKVNYKHFKFTAVPEKWCNLLIEI